MPMVKVSKRFRVEIPNRLRLQMNIKPGQELHMYMRDGAIRISVPTPITVLRGIAKGLRWRDDYRDRNDRF